MARTADKPREQEQIRVDVRLPRELMKRLHDEKFETRKSMEKIIARRLAESYDRERSAPTRTAR